MAAITLTIAEARLTDYLNAEEKVLLGQEVEINGQRMTRADLAAIQVGVRLWEGRVNRLNRTGGLRVREVIPR